MLETQTVVLGLKSGHAVLLDVVMCERSKKGKIVWERTGDLAEAIASSGFDVETWIKVDAACLDKRFQDAWRVVEGQVHVDMEWARDVHRDRIRAARAPLLKELDIFYQRADEIGHGGIKAAIATRKEQLRNCTQDPSIEAAQTPNELAASWPVVLSGAASFDFDVAENEPLQTRIDLGPILERLAAVEQNANEAKQQASTSLKIIDAIAKSAENVAEGKV